jgi:probable addiction module antidote protein
MKRKYRTYEESLHEALKDHDEALAYLNAALEDEDPKMFLLALKDVLIAQGIGIADFAQESSITRQNMYRILSEKGNPRWENLTSLLNALELQMHLSGKKSKVQPINIDQKLLKSLSKKAAKQGIGLETLINQKLSK